MKRIFLQYSTFVFLLIILHTDLFAQQQTDLVDIKMMDSTIIVDLKYATEDNFFKEKLYNCNICLLRRAVAERLVLVQNFLRKQDLGLKIWDGYRPLSVQKRMWQIYPKAGYVANPETGSNHNRGAAVDVTLVDMNGIELEMPTEFDSFSKKAGSYYQRLSENVLQNRKKLQNAMQRYGFKTISSEWWHFNDKNRKRYPILDIPLEEFIENRY